MDAFCEPTGASVGTVLNFIAVQYYVFGLEGMEEGQFVLVVRGGEGEEERKRELERELRRSETIGEGWRSVFRVEIGE